MRRPLGSVAGILVDLGQLKTRYSTMLGQRAAIAEIYPMVQAFLYMFVVMFMPIVLVLGRYRFRVFFTLSILLFAIIFCNFIWAVLQWFENALLESLSNPSVPGSYLIQNSALSTFFTVLYVIAPMFFLSLMSIAGYQIGGVMENSFVKGSGEVGQLSKQQISPTKIASTAAKIAKFIP